MEITNTSKKTIRDIEFKFETDLEYLSFIKLLACSPRLQDSPLYSWWCTEHEGILSNDELLHDYNLLSKK